MTDQTDLVTRYRSLLLREASVPALKESLALLGEACRIGFETNASRELRELDLEEQGSARYESRLSEHLRNYMESGLEADALKRRRKRQFAHFRDLIERTELALAHVPPFLVSREPTLPTATVSLGLDACFLIFHHAYFGLFHELPPSWEAERHVPARSFLLFSTHPELPRDRERHRALAYEALGDKAMAIHHWRLSVDRCPPDEHEFMTLVQSCWMALIDHDAPRGALNFLLEVSPRTRSAHRTELWQLVQETFEQFTRAHPAAE